MLYNPKVIAAANWVRKQGKADRQRVTYRKFALRRGVQLTHMGAKVEELERQLKAANDRIAALETAVLFANVLERRVSRGMTDNRLHAAARLYRYAAADAMTDAQAQDALVADADRHGGEDGSLS